MRDEARVSTIAEVAVRYRERGSGVPVLILHGAGVDHREMATALEPLFEERSGYRRIYVDLPGMGETLAPETLDSNDAVLDLLPATSFGRGSAYNPLFPFAFGLSHTTFQTSGLSASSSVPPGGTVTATFTVTNTGSRSGTDIVPVYVHQRVSTVIAPPKRLVGFNRVDVTPGQTKTVQVSFPVAALAVTQGDVDATSRPRVEPGSYQVQVDGLQADFVVS